MQVKLTNLLYRKHSNMDSLGSAQKNPIYVYNSAFYQLYTNIHIINAHVHPLFNMWKYIYAICVLT